MTVILKMNPVVDNHSLEALAQELAEDPDRREMLVRHDCSNKSNTAEMKVPACPMPIQNTKCTIPSAHPTGMLLPQVPIPSPTVRRMAAVSSKTPIDDTAKATHHHLERGE